MKYTIDWCESKVSQSGTNYKKATVTDESGQQFENVAIFQTFSKFDGVAPGAAIDAVLKAKNYKGQTSYTLENPQATTYVKRTTPMAQNMERKEKSIDRSMDRKEEAIKLSSTFRDATLIVTALAARLESAPTRDWLESEWKRWRAWLWNHYDDVTPMDAPPF